MVQSQKSVRSGGLKNWVRGVSSFCGVPKKALHFLEFLFWPTKKRPGRRGASGNLAAEAEKYVVPPLLPKRRITSHRGQVSVVIRLSKPAHQPTTGRQYIRRSTETLGGCCLRRYSSSLPSLPIGSEKPSCCVRRVVQARRVSTAAAT